MSQGCRSAMPNWLAANSRQRLQLAFGDRLGLGGKIAQEAEYPRRRSRHLVHQRQVRAGWKTKQLRRFVAEREDLDDARRVVVRVRVRPLVGGAGVVGGVDRLAQGAIVGEGQDRLHHRALERGKPTVVLLVPGRVGEHGARRLGQAGQFRSEHRASPGIGRIEHRLLEFGLDLAQLVLYFPEARARRLRQGHARQAEATQLVFDQRLPGAIEAGEALPIPHGLHRFEQGAVLAEQRTVFGDSFQRRRVGLAQFRRILHAMQVRHRRKAATQSLLQALQRCDQGVETARAGVGRQALDLHW